MRERGRRGGRYRVYDTLISPVSSALVVVTLICTPPHPPTPPPHAAQRNARAQRARAPYRPLRSCSDGATVPQPCFGGRGSVGAADRQRLAARALARMRTAVQHAWLRHRSGCTRTRSSRTPSSRRTPSGGRPCRQCRPTVNGRGMECPCSDIRSGGADFPAHRLRPRHVATRYGMLQHE
jgi:hypothetical protein